MTRRLAAIAFIFICTSLAWMLLGATLVVRSRESDDRLRESVSSTWGTRQFQHAPVAFTERLDTRRVEDAPVPERAAPDASTIVTPRTRLRTETVRTRVPLDLDQTRVVVAFDLEHRQKGLLWYATYQVNFDGTFRFRNSTASDSVTFELALPTQQAIYDGLRVTINGAPVPYAASGGGLVATANVRQGDSATLAVAYRSQGLDEWRYVLGTSVAEVRDFKLVMRTDFDGIDFPGNTLSPTRKRESAQGWELEWQYANLLSGFQIGMDMPKKLQPGPLAGQISLFAPVSLLFFFAVMFLIVTIRGIDLHPMNYAFLAAAFFAFHLLLAYLVDHISIHVAFLIASIVSVALVVSYLRLVIGPRFAFREAAIAQFTYLVLFSYAFFFKGFTGLAITIGSVLTLFIAMQLTGRIRWSEVFAGGPATGGIRPAAPRP